MALACLDIGGSLIKAARMDHAGAMPETVRRLPTPHDASAFLAAIAATVSELGDDISAVSLSMTGIIDPATGLLRIANIPALDGLALAPKLEAATGLPVIIANDADCFALAEAVHGAGRGHDNVFCIILGSGVGGSLVIGGRLVEGPGGFAGEWGHGTILMQEAGPKRRRIAHMPCGCGQWGCVNTVGGARGLEALFETLAGRPAASTAILADWVGGGDEATDVLDCWLDLVSAPLALVLNVTGSTIVPVGGGLSGEPRLITALDKAVRTRLLRQTGAPVLVPARLSGEAGLLGAAINAQRLVAHG